jgi:hypothetical protein
VPALRRCSHRRRRVHVLSRHGSASTSAADGQVRTGRCGRMRPGDPSHLSTGVRSLRQTAAGAGRWPLENPRE